jgi:hypothetical protein
MSAYDPKRTWFSHSAMFAFGCKADIGRTYSLIDGLASHNCS